MKCHFQIQGALYVIAISLTALNTEILNREKYIEIQYARGKNKDKKRMRTSKYTIKYL